MAKNKKTEKTKLTKIVNGELLISDEKFEQCPHDNNNFNEPLDRILITDEKKKQLAKFIKKYPEGRAIVEILIGNNETKRILGE